MFDTLLTNFHKLYRLYDAELKLSGVLVITVILVLGILAVTIFDKQTREFIPASYRDAIVYAAIAQMFGLYFYWKALKARKKKIGDPDLICPNCKVDMISNTSWKCIRCGRSFG